MKRLLLILIHLATFTSLKSQVKALTENGREVILYENGTWKYVSGNEKEVSNGQDSIITNSHEFFKSEGATFLVKSTRLNVGVYIDHTKWTFSAHKDNQVNPEFGFVLKSGQAYAMVLTEQTEVPLLSLRKIALENAKEAAVDAKIVSSEYRYINNNKVLCLKFTGTIDGIRLKYFGYYYSNPNGTVQLVTYSTEKVFNGVNNELEIFLNGFTVIK
jgi:hypothetical protein